MRFQPNNELPDGMRPFDINRIDPYACYRLVGAVIRHSILVTPSAAYPNATSYYTKKRKMVEVRAMRVRFGEENPLVGLWCALSGYDEGRVRKAIVLANQEEEV